MRPIKSGLLGALTASVVGTVAAAGCATAATGDDPVASAGAEKSDSGTVLPAPSETDARAPGDATTPDAGNDAGDAGDAGKDSGPPPAAPGDPCTLVGQKFKKACGKCGTQEAVCLATGVVSDYGACTGQIGLCEPSTTQACGNCGVRTCSNTCNWGACTGEPANACAPGTIDYTTNNCTEPQTYRQRTCAAATCAWGDYSSECVLLDHPVLTISGTINGTVSGDYSLTASQMGKRTATFSCTAESPTAAADHPYEVVEVQNKTAKTATVSAWLSGPVLIDTVLSAYATNIPPTTDAELKACTTTNNDCPATLSPACTSRWSGLTGTKAVTIPAGQAVILRFSSFYSHGDPDAQTATTGDVSLTVRTDALN